MREKRQRVFLLGLDFFTVGVWVWMMLDYLSKGRWGIPGFLVELYLLILVFYAGDKEIRRWRKRYRPHQRHGEWFVVVWAATFVLLFVVDFLGWARFGYHMPQELPLVVGSVVTIFLITEYLKTEFREPRRI